ncbi:hypothetical protein [Pseudomonas sp. M5]|uniref:hypothetical protein n=1 Tax=Pseudomonas sp. M5 TaxID=1620788 RepID=UPI00195F1A0A|nr:hypothetical protein [Pseudomonas sp. M5]MBM7399871.1 hypothetical protein [Pseudomonas sp. M5]
MSRRAAKRPQEISGATDILGLLRSPFATQGRSYPQQGASGRAEQSQVVMTLEALKVAIHACRSGLVSRRAAKRPQEISGATDILGLLRSPFATQGRSYPQQGASGRAEQSQVVMTLEALKVAIHACRSGLVSRRAAKRPQDISGATDILGLLRSPFATQGRSYPQQGASGRAEQSQVVMTLEALKVAVHACRSGLVSRRAAKRPQDISGATDILGLLRSPFATRGRSYPQQGASGRAEQSGG